jgi:hypothetical protein
MTASGTGGNDNVRLVDQSVILQAVNDLNHHRDLLLDILNRYDNATGELQAVFKGGASTANVQTVSEIVRVSNDVNNRFGNATDILRGNVGHFGSADAQNASDLTQVAGNLGGIRFA